MNIKTSIEKLAYDIAYDIASSGDDTQGNLLNGLGDGLYKTMQEKDADTQICAFVRNLNANGKKMIETIYAFIQFAKDNQ